MPIVDRIGEFHDEMTAWRRDIHAHPELGFEEHRTSDLVATRLEAFGLEVHRGIGRTGVVGALRVGNSPRSVGLRADMDALPIQETTGLEYSFRPVFNPTINAPPEAEFAASVCAELVGAENVERNPPLIMASEDFSFMLDRVPGCYVNLDNGDAEGACEVHNPGYDFNDQALPLGASFFARVVETRLARTHA